MQSVVTSQATESWIYVAKLVIYIGEHEAALLYGGPTVILDLTSV